MKLHTILLYSLAVATLNFSNASYADNEPTVNEGYSGAGISPTRVVVPAGQRSASVTLTNTSDVEVSYRMQMIEMGLDDQGYFRDLLPHELHAEHKSAIPVVRFSPRQVRLKPGQSQVVRAIARRSGMKEAGEYRSHLRLQALPILSDESLQNPGADSVLVNASAGIQIGVTIPVIVRHQQTDAHVSLNNLKLKVNPDGIVKSASLLLGLTGNRSAFGDFNLQLIDGNSTKTIGRLRSFALYHPYPEERIKISMTPDLKRGEFGPDSKIRVQFINKAIDSAKDFWLDDEITPVFE